ncbi:hypothetical protein ACFVFS_07200 [Kitasatospora sp. NPDC057692]|uniref:hypothetical protein n=1 Tax=Kitasatospora sp. NPDC057692 TaxID=3346215 RepID=UPI00368F1211
MTTPRARSACLAATAALACLLLAPAASAAPAPAAAVPAALPAPAAPAPAAAPLPAACNEAGTRQPGDMLMQVRVDGGGKYQASYPGYTITRIEARTLLGTPNCLTILDGGPGTDHVTLTTAQPLGTLAIYAKRN